MPPEAAREEAARKQGPTEADREGPGGPTGRQGEEVAQMSPEGSFWWSKLAGPAEQENPARGGQEAGAARKPRRKHVQERKRIGGGANKAW